MNKIEPYVFEIIIDYIYTPNVKITEENVQVKFNVQLINFVIL